MAPTSSEEDAEASVSRSRAIRRRSRSRTVCAPSRGKRSPRSIEPDTGVAPTAAQDGVEALPAGSRAVGSATPGGGPYQRIEPDAGMVLTATQDLAGVTSASMVADEGASTAAEAYVPTSPIRIPYLPCRVVGNDSNGKEIYEAEMDIDPAIYDAYMEEKEKYFKKLDNVMKLPTMDKNIPLSCINDPEFLLIRESATKTILQAAKSVLRLSSYIDGELLQQSSGILIDCNEGIGTVLTSAHFICSKSVSTDEWLGGQEYAVEAEVRVHLLDDIVVKGQLVYHHKHYDFAFINFPLGLPVQLACFGSEAKFAQNVFVLGRDENFDIRVSNGKVQYKGPSLLERHHYMYIDADVHECGIGGPIIDLSGEVIGMTSRVATMAFIPCSIILKCLHLWKTFSGCVPRLHLGFKLSSIKFLDLGHIERISRKCNVDAGLIVEEVSGGSIAEKLGVRIGDIIQAVNGKCVSTTIELENTLLQICEDHLIKGNDRYSSTDVMVGIYYTNKRVPGTIKLRANVSDDVEIVAREF